MNIYFYPPVPQIKEANYNPYIEDFVTELSKHKNVINNKDISKYAILNLAGYVFKIDVCIFNWIENLPVKKLGKLQTLFFISFIFPILIIRKTKIIWVFHNITMHQGDNFLSRLIKKLMFNYSDLIITHSEEAKEFIRKQSKATVYCADHPIKLQTQTYNPQEKIYDILIWGTIEPYKGILEFINYITKEKLDKKYKIKIVGKCKKTEYLLAIQQLCNENIIFENKAASFEELEYLIKSSRYVLFPYISGSVSSSGALIDTLSFYGNPIGPDKGAFKDLNKKGVCFIFEEYKDIISILDSEKSIPQASIENFIHENTWNTFIKRLIDKIK
ncbi:MAG: hypothetical protein LUG18_12330 [Candidatus Azobacteroides sp.]|nr:hypothetical protein [Candidatus Azobacteroides sp.]